MNENNFCKNKTYYLCDIFNKNDSLSLNEKDYWKSVIKKMKSCIGYKETSENNSKCLFMKGYCDRECINDRLQKIQNK